MLRKVIFTVLPPLNIKSIQTVKSGFINEIIQNEEKSPGYSY